MIDRVPLPPSENPDEAFASVVALRRLARSLEQSAVDHALEQGWTWAQIGQALGMSAQAAHKRLAPSKRSQLNQGKAAR